MEPKDALNLFVELSNAMQMFWNFYITVVLALLGFFAAADLGKKRYWVTAIFSLAFGGFAIANAFGLAGAAQERLDACLALAPSGCNGTAIQIMSPLVMTLNPPTIVSVTAFHVTADIFVIAAIWLLTWRPR